MLTEIPYVCEPVHYFITKHLNLDGKLIEEEFAVTAFHPASNKFFTLHPIFVGTGGEVRDFLGMSPNTFVQVP